MSERQSKELEPVVAGVLRAAAARRDQPLVERLRSVIGLVPPGAWLGNSELLAEMFGCTPTTIRYAMRQLRGLVVGVSAGHGGWFAIGYRSLTRRVAEAIHAWRLAAGPDGPLGTTNDMVVALVDFSYWSVRRELQRLVGEGRIASDGGHPARFHNVGEPEQRA